MDILPIFLLIASAATVFWLLFQVFSNSKSHKAKDEFSLAWAKATLGIVGLFVVLSIGNFRSNYGFSTLNALIWLALIAPVAAIGYFFYHVSVLIKKPYSASKKVTKVVAENRRRSKLYVLIFLLLVLLSISYPIARRWKDQQNIENFKKGNPYTCDTVAKQSSEYCLDQANHNRQVLKERLGQ